MTALIGRALADEGDVALAAEFRQPAQLGNAIGSQHEALLIMDAGERGIVIAIAALFLILEVFEQGRIRGESFDVLVRQLPTYTTRVMAHRNHYVTSGAVYCAGFEIVDGGFLQHDAHTLLIQTIKEKVSAVLFGTESWKGMAGIYAFATRRHCKVLSII